MKGFIKLPDDKGNVHHFRYRDLNSFRDGYFHYEPQGGFCTLLSAVEIKAIVEPTPDDALVEAVKDDLVMAKNHAETLQQQFCCYGTKHGDGGHCDCKFIVGNRGGEETGCAEARSIIQLLTQALAAHEKAGG